MRVDNTICCDSCGLPLRQGDAVTIVHVGAFQVVNTDVPMDGSGEYAKTTFHYCPNCDSEI